MIRGSVTSRKEITVPIQVRDITGSTFDIEPIVDTGFSGALTLPSAAIASLQLQLKSRTRTVMANGSVQTANIFVGTVVWDGRDRLVLVHEMDCHPLIGIKLLEDHQLRASIQPGGLVEIEELP
jgi:clan AA aspartic protease